MRARRVRNDLVTNRLLGRAYLMAGDGAHAAEYYARAEAEAAEIGVRRARSEQLPTFFLGAGGSPLPWAPFTLVPSWIWMLSKAMFMMFVFLWVRWTLPRYRYDQLMRFGWKVLLPAAVVNLIIAAAMVVYLGV